MQRTCIHIHIHIHTAPIDQSTSRGGSSRIVSGPPVSTTQRAAASSLHPMAHYRCCFAVLLCFCASVLPCCLAAQSLRSWGDGPQLDGHAPCE